MNETYYVLKRQDGTLYGLTVDRVSEQNINDCKIYREADRSQFEKEWAPYFTFIGVLWDGLHGTYKFANPQTAKVHRKK